MFFRRTNVLTTVITVEFSLLLVELILLIVTVILLVMNLREEKGRQDLIKEVGRATKVLTRQEYFNEVIRSYHDAKKSIFGCVTGSPPDGEEEGEMIDTIVKHIRDLTKEGVKITFMIPKFTDRLNIGYRFSQAGAEVFYNNCALVNDARYMVVDDRFVLIGVPEKVGENEPTKKGYRVPSIGLSAIIREHYDQCANSKFTATYEEYVKEIIQEMKRIKPELDFEPVARELQIPIGELKRIDILNITSKPTLKVNI